MFKQLRILILLSLLLLVALAAYQKKQDLINWNNTKWVMIYPINGDQQESTAAYIRQLTVADFIPIEEFLRAEGAHHQLSNPQPVKILLAPELTKLPPQYPVSGGFLDRILWSLSLRMWASDVTDQYDNGPVDVQMFVQFYDPKTSKVLDHSLGVSELALGIVKAFATPRMGGSNNVVITHELLHIFGATDKYDLKTNMPLYPDGFGEPAKVPLYPQQLAEIMGGRIVMSRQQAVTPQGLDEVLIGPKTAREINWLQ